MNVMPILFASTLCIGLVACSGPVDKPQSFPLREAVVVYEDALDTGSSDPWRDWGRRGVADLTNGVFRATGASLPVVSESNAGDCAGRPVIYVGNTAAARAAGLDAGALANEDALIRVASDRAFIVARTGLGASAGCGRFLETQADYYMMTVSGDDPVTFDPTRRAQVGELAVRPAVPWRYFHFFTASRFPKTSKNLVDYGRRIRCMVNRECSEPITEAVKHAHTFFEFCRPEDFAATHPEYFSLGKDGKRHFTWNSNSQLCLSAPGVFDIVYSNLVRVVEKDRAMCRAKGVRPSTVFEFSQMDSCGYMCWCPACSKVIEKYNRKKGGNWEGGDAALQLLFVNRLARKIRGCYPEVKIRTFAYVSTEGAPEGIAVEPNVIIRLCDLYSRSDHMRPLESPFNAPRLKLIDDWFRLTPNIEIWDYRLYGGLTWEGVFPEVDVDAIAADTKLFVRYGLPRLFQQHHFENQPFFELNAFVESQFLTDPSADLGETIDRYCRVYGKGAAAMRKAIDFFRGIIRDNPPVSETDWHARLLPWRTVANMEHLKGLVADAYALETPGARARGRIAEVLAAVEMELVRLYQAVPGARTKLAEAKRDCETHYREGIVAGAVDPADREREMRTFLGILQSLGLVFEDVPAELKNVPKDEIFYLSLSTAYVPRSMNDLAISDPTSEMKSVARWRPSEEPRLPLACAASGCKTAAGSGPFAVEPVSDGRWHWHRLGVVRISAGGRITVPAGGGPSFRLKDYYINCDGLAVDPNWYEVWVSLKRVGGSFATADKSKGLFVDRLILHRVLRQD